MIRQSAAQIVDVPDTNFLKALINAGVDINTDGKIQTSEAAAITKLSVAGANISDLNGIQAFINLDTLNCSLNELTSLDLSQNTKLILLYCSVNKLTSLDLSENTGLIYLSCSNNKLTSLDVKGNPELIILDCGFNELTTLDVSANTKLEILECYVNQLDSLNLSANTRLISLYCGNNNIGSLDLSQSIELKLVDCQFNKLTSINISENSKLTDLACFSNQLTSLDVTKNVLLARLDCGLNLYTSLDLSYNDSLVSVDCSQNQNLEYICVKDTALVSNNFYFLKDDNAQWKEDCNQTTGLDEDPLSFVVELAPNPGKESFNLLLQQPATIRICDTGGSEIEHFTHVQNLQFGENYRPGLYFVNIIFPNQPSRKVIKIIKE
jgi:hypothetical protein